jgi:hypothetical protein
MRPTDLAQQERRQDKLEVFCEINVGLNPFYERNTFLGIPSLSENGCPINLRQ